MKTIHDMRERRTWQQHRHASPLPIVLGGVIAFGIGLLGVSGIIRTPNLFPQKTQTPAVAPNEASAPGVAIDTAAARIGRAETAPLLKTCMPMQKPGVDPDQSVKHGDLYRIPRDACAAPGER